MKKGPPAGTSVLGLLKRTSEVMRPNSGNSWEEEQPQSQKQDGRVLELFIIGRNTQSGVYGLGNSASTLKSTPSEMKAQHQLLCDQAQVRGHGLQDTWPSGM